MIKTTLLLALCAIGAAASATARYASDTVTTSDSVYVIPEQTLYQKVTDIVNTVVDRRFNDPKAPRFLFIDQKHQYALGIGGYFRMVNGLEFDGLIPDSRDAGFSVASIPIPNTDYENSQYSLAFNSSTIYLNLLGSNRKLGPFSLYLSAKFDNSTYALEADRVYLNVWNLTLGYASSTFNDDPSKAPQIDGSGPNGSSFLSTILARYTWNATPSWRFAVSVEKPEVQATVPVGLKVGSQRSPTVPAFIQYQWNGGRSHVRLSGMIRPMNYMDTVRTHHYTAYGWGIQLSGPLALSPWLTWYYQLVYGRGIANRISDLSVLNVDLVPNPSRPNTLQALPLYAIYTAAKVTFRPNLYAAVIYSHARLFSQNGYRPPEGYKMSHQVVLNLFWDVTPDLQLALEYNYGRKLAMDNRSGHANRINTLVQLTF